MLAMNEAGPHLSAAMCRDARVLLRTSQEELASLAGISLSTLRRLERGDSVSDYPLQQIIAALTSAGIVFVGAEKAPALK